MLYFLIAIIALVIVVVWQWFEINALIMRLSAVALYEYETRKLIEGMRDGKGKK